MIFKMKLYWSFRKRIWKRTAVEDYRITNRGGKGVITLNITEKQEILLQFNRLQTKMD